MSGSCYRILLRLRFRLDHTPHPPRILFFFILQDREGGIQIAAPSHPELDLELGHARLHTSLLSFCGPTIA